MKIYYKVVTCQLLSSINNHYLPSDLKKYMVKYEIGKWVSPTVKDTRLFVFNSLQGAKDFVGGKYKYKIYECHVKNPRKNPPIIRNFYDINTYWSKRLKHLKINYLGQKVNSFRSGCSSCDEIKLLRRVF